MITVLMALTCQGVSPGAEGDKSLQTLVQLDAGAADLTLRDMDGDKDLDLVRVDGAGLTVFALDDNGRYPSAPTALLGWPVGRVAWTVADLDGSGAHRVLMLTAEGRVLRHDFDGSTFQPPVLMVEDKIF
ncbi:MAG: VCBS repeat-containing protein, partial [Planctomycetota bacterium]|nr:VCBS repeat-containing protein [Planctomycetota bacterium]